METHLLLIYLIFFSFKKNLTFKKMQSFPSVFDWMLCVAGFMKLSIYFHILGLILYFGLRLVLLLCFWWQQFPSLLDLKAVSCIYSSTSEKVKFACLRNMFGVNVLVHIFRKKKKKFEFKPLHTTQSFLHFSMFSSYSLLLFCCKCAATCLYHQSASTKITSFTENLSNFKRKSPLIEMHKVNFHHAKQAFALFFWTQQ